MEFSAPISEGKALTQLGIVWEWLEHGFGRPHHPLARSGNERARARGREGREASPLEMVTGYPGSHHLSDFYSTSSGRI